MSGEGEYNLDILEEIAVTDSFFELEKEDIKCQSYKSKSTFDNCTTNFYSEQLRLNCGCLPFAIRNDEKVCYTIMRFNLCIR